MWKIYEVIHHSLVYVQSLKTPIEWYDMRPKLKFSSTIIWQKYTTIQMQFDIGQRKIQ